MRDEWEKMWVLCPYRTLANGLEWFTPMRVGGRKRAAMLRGFQFRRCAIADPRETSKSR